MATLHEWLFERGPMPAASVVCWIVGLLIVFAYRPRTVRQLAWGWGLGLLPVALGAAGYAFDLHEVQVDWQAFLANRPTPSEVEEFRGAIVSDGDAAAWGPIYLGAVLGMIQAMMTTAIYFLSRNERAGG